MPIDFVRVAASIASRQRFAQKFTMPHPEHAFHRSTHAILAMALSVGLTVPTGSGPWAADLKTLTVSPAATTAATGFDGVVEAIRQAVVSAQVAGNIVALEVKVGDRVSAGQVLARVDARAAEQAATASDAQAAAAKASLELASKEFERQKQLFAQQFISRAALDRAESEYKANAAQANAQLAQAGAARTQSGFYVLKAPFGGVIAEVPVQLGDMAMPGRPVVTVYEPGALRVTAAVAQTVAMQLNLSKPNADLKVEIPGWMPPGPWVQPIRVQRLPTVDPSTLTMQVRADLPPGLQGLSPGMFARVWLPTSAATRAASAASVPSIQPSTQIWVPASALVRRAEMMGVYVLTAEGKPLLRQVRVGRVEGAQVEVLSGLNPGDKVALEPQVAAGVR
jgi:RND family efflux transporter MFP subunit